MEREKYAKICDKFFNSMLKYIVICVCPCVCCLTLCLDFIPRSLGALKPRSPLFQQLIQNLSLGFSQTKSYFIIWFSFVFMFFFYCSFKKKHQKFIMTKKLYLIFKNYSTSINLLKLKIYIAVSTNKT